MGLLYTGQKSKIKRKMTAKRKDEQSSWEALLKKYEPKTQTNSTTTKQAISITKPAAYRRETRHIESLGASSLGDCTKRVSQRYTGTAILGIATMHKSNAVPVFSQKDAEEISRMRR